MNNKRFTSYDRSSVTGLDYAINRTYDSKLGRFTQIDPIGVKASNLEVPQTLNLYSYCGNDPVNNTDPDGLFFGKLFKWIGKLFVPVFKAVGKFIIKALTAVSSGVMGVLRMLGQIPVIGAFIQTVGTLVYLGFLLMTAQWTMLARTIVGLYVQAFIDGAVGVIAESVKSEIHEHGFWGGLFRGLGKGFKYLAQVLFGRGILGFTVIYGFFCGPKYGSDGPQANEEPIDDVDGACRWHDLEMERIKKEIKDPKERAKAKLRADSIFMRRILLSRSRNVRAGAFRPLAIIGFLIRDVRLLIVRRA